MSRPIEQALNTLIPRRPGALPRELIELASSLLAQSRNKCSNLKPEEEIARTYICANLACERLKTTLDLPQIEPSPPIPPRTYKKLYTYFNNALTISAPRKKALATSSAKTTPASTPQKLKAATPLTSRQSPRLLPQRQTPSKEAAFASFRTPRTGLKHVSNPNEKPVPKWVAPCIRQLCKDLDTPRAIPHIMAGVESILRLPISHTLSTPGTGKGKAKATEGPEEPLIKAKLHALIACLWFFTVLKMRGPENQNVETSTRKRLARESILSFRTNPSVITKIGSLPTDWEGWAPDSGLLEKDVNTWRKELLSNDWREMDWYLNIEEGEGVGNGENEETDGSEGFEMEEVEEGVKAAREGKRVLDRYDYLSEEKKREYEAWRLGLLEKVKEMIAEAKGKGENEEGDQVMEEEGEKEMCG